MTKRILALLLTLCLMISAAPVLAGAATGQQVSANAVTVTAGNTASVTLKAENFTNIAALDVYVYYDASVLTLSSTSDGSMLSGAQTSVNTAQAGEIKLSAMSLNGISGSGNLLTVYFQTSADCTAGNYPIEVAIGRAYDTNLAVATVGRVNGSVTVNKPVVTETFRLYATASATTLQKGDVLTYSVRNSASRAFVSGEFTVEYDPELFDFQSLELHANLSGAGAVYSVNSNVPGMVRIAYAKDAPVNSYYLYTLKLTVIADVNAAATVEARAFNVYREDLTAYQPGSCSTNMTLQKLPEVADHANVFLKTDRLEVGKQTKSTFCVEAGAGIAAADFTVSYDPQVLRCVAVTMLPEAEEKGSMVIINDHFTEGTIRFSYVNMDAYAGELSLVEITWEPITSAQTHFQTSISGVGVVDAKQNPITLEYVADSGCIFVPVVVLPTCLEDGYTTYTCHCGDTQVEVIPATGHSYESVITAPTCTEAGYTTYTCLCGDSYIADEAAALGHSFVEGVCGVCGETDPDYVKPVVVPTLALKAPALEFKDMIKVIAFFTVDDMTSVEELGMITYTEKVDVIDINTAAHVIPGADYEESSARYFASSQGIHAKYLGDTVYLACYAKLTDGTYVYTKLAPYSPITYATNQLKNSTNVELKQLVAAMLNYGAAAQNYFTYNTDVLANSTLTAEQINLPEAYSSDMVASAPTADAAKQGIFANNKGFSVRKPAVSFEGAFSINYWFTPAYTPVDGITLYYWTEADFAAADVLTVDNATGAIDMVIDNNQYRADIEGIAAKDLSKTVYVAAVYSDGTTTWTSGVLGYSIGAYCGSLATKGGAMADLAMATAVYGYHAKAYFGT